MSNYLNNKQFQDVHFGLEALDKIHSGAETLAKAVRSTMGPSGHNVIIDRQNNAPFITKDGVTVAKAINLKEKLPSVGVELLKEVASKTNEVAGDGPQPLDSKVLTPNGWVTMGSLKIGDKICGTNNSIQNVIGIFPKGKKEVFKITLGDGRIVECCEDHLWKVITYYGKEKIITTKNLLENGIIKYNKDKNWKVHKYFIPTTSVDFNDNSKKLTIDPYLLGVLLGDGSLSTKREIEIALGFKDEYILDEIKLPERCKIRKKYYYNKNYIKVTISGVYENNKKSIIKTLLKELNLLGTNSDTKFIPKEYLYSSLENRKKLLNGLIDTDGHISSRNLFTFSTVSEQLHLDFVELCRSLGKQIYICKTIRKPGSSYGTKPIYRITELKGDKYGLKIRNIEKTGKQVEMQCIKVSNLDSLYITNDYIQTHNTTTGTVLGYEMLTEGIKMIATGRSAIGLKRGMDIGSKRIIETVKAASKSVRGKEDIINVGTISANGDREIGEMLTEAIEKVGENGIITVEPAKSFKTSLEVVEGMQFETGYISPYFITNHEKLICEYEDCWVLITNKKLSSLQDLINPLEKAADSNKPLLIIADEIEGEALHTLIVNKMKGVLKTVAVKAPSYGENRMDILNDIKSIVGGELFDASTATNLKNLEYEHFGFCKKIIVSRHSTTILGSLSTEEEKNRLSDRINSIKSALINDFSLDELRKSNYKKRLAKLSGGVAVIKVGGSTEVEIMEKKDRVDDALNATIAAVQEGIVPGGGTALFFASIELDKWLKKNRNKISEDEQAGIQIIINACKGPLKTIIQNTGASYEVIANALIKNKNKTGSFGYDASKHEYCDLIEKGIIDPVKVERCAVEFASSIISLLLSCNAYVINEDMSYKDKEE